MQDRSYHAVDTARFLVHFRSSKMTRVRSRLTLGANKGLPFRAPLLALTLGIVALINIACTDAQIKQMEADHNARVAQWDGFWAEVAQEMDKGWGLGGSNAADDDGNDDGFDDRPNRNREVDDDDRRDRRDRDDDFGFSEDEEDEREDRRRRRDRYDDDDRYEDEDDPDAGYDEGYEDEEEEPTRRRRWRRGRRRRADADKKDERTGRRSSAFRAEDSLFGRAGDSRDAEEEYNKRAEQRRRLAAERKGEKRGSVKSRAELISRVSDGYTPWTIECNAFEGRRRQELAERVAVLLAEVPELDPGLVEVKHDDDRSRVNYGVYPIKFAETKTGVFSKEVDDVKAVLSDRIRAELEFIRKLAIRDQYPFIHARPIPIIREIRGPSAWDLRRARGKYSLHVGVTYATPNLQDYKKAALQWVEVLREAGHEAYYYDDPDEPRVSICVGSFGPDAIRTKMVTDPTTNQEEPIQVYGQVVNDLRAQDPSFEFNLENGHKVFRKIENESGKVERLPNLSFLIEIPREGQRLSEVKKRKSRRDRGRRGRRR